jgi:predicted amidohydrolase
MKVRNSLKDNLTAATMAIRKAARQKPMFIALPEYFSVPNNMEQLTSAWTISKETYVETMKFLVDTSKELQDIYLLGGTVLEEEQGRYYNTSTLWRNGSLVGKYRKRNPINAELKAGISRGYTPAVFSTEHCKVGMLVCADMFDPPTIKAVVELGAELVVKVGNVSSSARGGRSAFITPWGIEREVSDMIKDAVMTIDLDMQKLRKYRRSINRT